MDHLIRAIGANGGIRVQAAITTDLVEEARTRHTTSPTATVALGRALSGTVLLCSTIEKAGRLMLRILGDGPLGGILAEADAEGTVRGYVQNPHVDLPWTDEGKFRIREAVGSGKLTVTRDLGYGNPYTGVVELASGEIGQDIAHYLAHSEQIPSAVSLGIYLNQDGSVRVAGGLIVQLMPGTGDEIAWRVQQTLQNFPPYSKLLQEGLSLPEIVHRSLAGFSVEILDRDQPLRFQCRCNQQRVEKVLVSLGREEIADMIRTDGQAEIRCHFCNAVYLFSAEHLQQLLDQIVNQNGHDNTT